jgi:hypothetical protein
MFVYNPSDTTFHVWSGYNWHPIATQAWVTNIFGGSIAVPGYNRLQWDSSFKVAAFDTTTRQLTLTRAGDNSTTTVLIPKGGDVNGISNLTPSRLGNIITITGDNGSISQFGIRDADSSAKQPLENQRLSTTDNAVFRSITSYLTPSEGSIYFGNNLDSLRSISGILSYNSNPLINSNDTTGKWIINQYGYTLGLQPSKIGISDTMRTAKILIADSSVRSNSANFGDTTLPVYMTSTPYFNVANKGNGRIDEFFGAGASGLNKEGAFILNHITGFDGIIRKAAVFSVTLGHRNSITQSYLANVHATSVTGGVGSDGTFFTYEPGYGAEIFPDSHIDSSYVPGIPKQLFIKGTLLINDSTAIRNLLTGASSDSLLVTNNGLLKRIQSSALGFVKYTDTSGMLINRFKNSDTAILLNNYARLSNIPISISGTTNQIFASAPTGNIVLSLPQSIATNSTVQFTRVNFGGAGSNVYGDGSGLIFEAGVNEILYYVNGSYRGKISNTGHFLIGTLTDDGSGSILQIAGGASITGSATVGSLIKAGGTSSQFLKADGSSDANTYLTSVDSTVFSTKLNVVNQLNKYTGTTNTMTVGILTTGSIGSGFGNINIGSNTITAGNGILSGSISTGATGVTSAGAWKLGTYSSGGTYTADGFIIVTINGVDYAINAAPYIATTMKP